MVRARSGSLVGGRTQRQRQGALARILSHGVPRPARGTSSAVSRLHRAGGHASGVAQDVSAIGEALGPRPLGVQGCLGLLVRDAVRIISRWICSSSARPPAAPGHVSRRRLRPAGDDEELVRPPPPGLALHLGANGRVQDGLETLLSRQGPRKCARACAAGRGSLGSSTPGPNGPHDRRERGPPGLDDFACDDVGVDQRDAEPRQTGWRPCSCRWRCRGEGMRSGCGEVMASGTLGPLSGPGP